MAKELKILPMVLSVTDAGIWKRIIGYSLDILFVAYVFAYDLFAYLSNYVTSFHLSAFDSVLVFEIALALTFILYIYFFVMIYLTGSTVGTWLVGAKLVKKTDKGVTSNLSLSQSLIYSIIPSLVFLMPVLVLLDYLLALMFGKTFSEWISGLTEVEFKVNQNVVMV